MKKQLFKTILFLAILIGTIYQAKSQTAGTLTFTVNPVAYTTSTYANTHFIAAWIEDSASTFIKTRNRYGSSGNCMSAARRR